MSTASQPVRDLGETQASSVRAPVSRREEASLTVTQLLVPLKDKASPYFPVATQAALEMVPLFPEPDESTTTGPAPSLNPYAATSAENSNRCSSDCTHGSQAR